MKLAPEDLYALGISRGGIDERWLSSTVRADNLGAPEDEGLSYVTSIDSRKRSILFKNVIESIGNEVLGKEIMNEFGGWTVLAKFFDNSEPIPLHLHQQEEQAKRVGLPPKPEAYYFPIQMNLIEGAFPFTFFGLKKGTTREDIKNCISLWESGDNGILKFSVPYRLSAGTGWLVQAGILHAPGTYVTYEVQKSSDVFAMYQSMLCGHTVSRDLLTRNVPQDHHNDLDYLVDMIDWGANLDSEFERKHFLKPVYVEPPALTRKEGYQHKWIIYGSEDFGAKELTVFPKSEVKIFDESSYGLIVIQGHGRIGQFDLESHTMIRYGQPTNDEFFVSIGAAKDGVEIINKSDCENLVILKHFGPGDHLLPNQD